MEYFADVGISILILIMLALSLNMVVGYTGQISLAHAVFYGLGGYTVGLLTLASDAPAVAAARGVTAGAGWPFLPALVVATLLTFVVGVILAFPALRVAGEYVILLTLALQVVAFQLMNNLPSVTGGPYGLTPIPPIEFFGLRLSTPSSAFPLFLAITLAIAAITWWVGVSPFGRVLRGIREDEQAVAATGKNTTAAKVLVFGLAASLAGLVGGLGAAYYRFIAPGNYSLEISIILVAIVVLGGSGNVMGVMVGGLLLGGLRPLLQNLVGDTGIVWQSVVYGLGLVLIMLLRPGGVFPEGVGLDGFLQRRFYRPMIARLESNDGSADGWRDEGRRAAVASMSAAGSSELSELQPIAMRGVALTKSFAGIQAVDDATIELGRGQITGLVGPNGAGKTTLFNLLTGTIAPDAGTVYLDDEDITGLSIHRLARRGVVRSFQDVRVFENLSVLDNVAMAVPGQSGENPFWLALRPIRVVREEADVLRRAREAMRFVGIEEHADKRVADLSFGDHKLVAIARVLATGADVLLLDEPTSGIDPTRVDEVIELIKQLGTSGKTVCIIEHSVHLIGKLADEVVFLEDGRVVAQGPMGELRKQDRLVEIYFGT